MRQERTDRERLFDDAVLLYLWVEAAKRTSDQAVGDRLKLTKLAYLATDEFYWSGTKAINLPFYRYKRGPYAKELNTTWDDLTRCNHLVEDEQFWVTEQGERLAADFGSEVLEDPTNQHIRNVLDRIVNEWGAADTKALLDFVYDKQSFTLDSGRKKRVGSLPMYTDLTAILDEGEANSQLVVSPGWEMTLELALHPEALRNLERSLDSLHSGAVYGWEALGTDV